MKVHRMVWVIFQVLGHISFIISVVEFFGIWSLILIFKFLLVCPMYDCPHEQLSLYTTSELCSSV